MIERSDPYPYLWLIDPDLDPGSPKNTWIRGSVSATLLLAIEVHTIRRMTYPIVLIMFSKNNG